MVFILESTDVAAKTVVEEIKQSIEHGTVLWLVSGGSAIPPQMVIMERLAKEASGQLDKLTILPVDERYGLSGHPYSNFEQMRRAGFAPGAAKWFNVLAQGGTVSETIDRYEKLIEDSFARAKTVIATLGLGADGHTAGILPGSPAATDMVSTVIAYEWSDYTRMTLGLTQLQHTDSAFVFAHGEAKCEALKRLQTNTEPTSLLPAKVLYDIPNVTVYNDCIKSEE